MSNNSRLRIAAGEGSIFSCQNLNFELRFKYFKKSFILMENQELPIYVVDSFTNKPFAGNPAAVCVLQNPLTNTKMQLIAR